MTFRRLIESFLYIFMFQKLGILDRMQKVLFKEVLFGAVFHPGDDFPAQDALHGAGVKVPEHLEWNLKVSEPPKEAEEASVTMMLM